MQTAPPPGSTCSPDSKPRSLLIIQRTETKLFDYVRRSFANYPDVEVIRDRRTGERRQGKVRLDFERRRFDRRARGRVEEQLRARGWVLVAVGNIGRPGC